MRRQSGPLSSIKSVQSHEQEVSTSTPAMVNLDCIKLDELSTSI